MIHRTVFRRAIPTKRIEWEHLLTDKCPNMPPLGSRFFKVLGSQIVKDNAFKDAGKVAYDDCLEARRQIEQMINSIGYDLSVFFFGGVSSLGFYEVSGDLDFCAVADVEPCHEEASLIVQNIAKGFRRMGLRPMAIPRAFVPIIRCDRTANIRPASVPTIESRRVSFTFARELIAAESQSFTQRLRNRFGQALEFQWSKRFISVRITFESTSDAVAAMATTKKHENIDIVMRQPADSRDGPELFRFPFDICFNSMGAQNTNVMRKALLEYPGARHLLLALRRWGKNCGNISSIDGFLASYCYTVMLVHFLQQAGRIQPLNPAAEFVEPLLLPKEPAYVPLRQQNTDVEDIGYLYYHFINYYAHIFKYDTDVVNVTSLNMKKEHLGWTDHNASRASPPFFSFAVKDPFGKENCARIVDAQRAKIIQQNFALASHTLDSQISDPLFAIKHLEEDSRRIEGEKPTEDLIEHERARIELIKKKFLESQTRKVKFGSQHAAESKMSAVASSLTNSVLLWMKRDKAA